MHQSKLARLRESRGLSLAALAKMLHPPTTATQIMRLEIGERKLTAKWVDRLAEVLSVSPYEIYEDSTMLVTVQERELIERLRLLPEAQRVAILSTVRSLAATGMPSESDR